MSSGARSGKSGGKRCLVTGGAGFIGSHLVDHLLDRGDEVVVVDNFSTGKRSNLRGHENDTRLRVIESDASDAVQGFGSHERFDQVYHLAAAVGVKRIIEQPIESIETNIRETSAVLHYAASCAARRETPPAVLIASSSEVYGKGSKSPFSEEDDCVYGPTTALRWSYACTKAIDEYLALAHHARSGLPVVVARFFNTVGPRQVGEYGMVLPNFIDAVLAGRSPEVYGDGTQTRCFCDVRDIAPVLPRMIESSACHGRVFNLGSDSSISIADLARLVARTLGSDIQPVLIPYDRAYAPGFEDLRQRRPDLRRIRGAVGFEPTIDLARTIRDVARTRGWSASDQ
ncbi:MAG: NAD-dependent epimerase/dehydratase family protein [Phycisphaerae bacterium]|nr:NAD-dependent epimerase/dehydratase family protein [Phycisphaerae bacterium]